MSIVTRKPGFQLGLVVRVAQPARHACDQSFLLSTDGVPRL